MKTKHTPGPWSPDWLDDSHGWILDRNGNYLAEIVSDDEENRCAEFKEREANARLMSAAPDLLSALIQIESEADFDADGDSISRGEKLLEIATLARAAIAQAEGETK